MRRPARGATRAPGNSRPGNGYGRPVKPRPYLGLCVEVDLRAPRSGIDMADFERAVAVPPSGPR